MRDQRYEQEDRDPEPYDHSRYENHNSTVWLRDAWRKKDKYRLVARYNFDNMCYEIILSYEGRSEFLLYQISDMTATKAEIEDVIAKECVGHFWYMARSVVSDSHPFDMSPKYLVGLIASVEKEIHTNGDFWHPKFGTKASLLTAIQKEARSMNYDHNKEGNK